jgi:hypothetical protein
MRFVSVGSNIASVRLRHEPVHRDVAVVHRHGGHDEGLQRERDGRRAGVLAQQGVVVAAAVAEAPPVPVEGEAGNNNEVERVRRRPVRGGRLPDAERSRGQAGARRIPGQAVPAGRRVPGRNGHSPAGTAARGQDARRGGLPRRGEVERDGPRGAEGRQADKPRRRAGGPRGKAARAQGLAHPPQAAAQRRLAGQDGASGARGVLLRDSQASMRLRIVSS